MRAARFHRTVLRLLSALFLIGARSHLLNTVVARTRPQTERATDSAICSSRGQPAAVPERAAEAAPSHRRPQARWLGRVAALLVFDHATWSPPPGGRWPSAADLVSHAQIERSRGWSVISRLVVRLVVGSTDDAAFVGVGTDEGDEVGCVDGAPAALADSMSLKGHGDAGSAGAGSPGDPLTEPDRGEGGLDRVGGAQVDPVLGRVVVNPSSTSRSSVNFAAALGHLVPYAGGTPARPSPSKPPRPGCWCTATTASAPSWAPTQNRSPGSRSRVLAPSRARPPRPDRYGPQPRRTGTT